jgi:hypothetical protein
MFFTPIFLAIQQKVLFITSSFSDEPQKITVTLSSISNLTVLRILPGDNEQPQSELAQKAQAKSSRLFPPLFTSRYSIV